MRVQILALATCLLALPAEAQYSGGSGTADDPYQIATAADLIALGETPDDYDKHFVLTADIDLDPNLPGRKVFDRAIVATISVTDFSGVFDGNGHKISHMTIVGEGRLGLFGRLKSQARVMDLGVEDVNIVGSGYDVGGLVGRNCGTVNTCYSTGVVVGGRYVGGLTGRNEDRISTSYSIVEVIGESSVGGLVGSNDYYDGKVVNCYSSGSVDGDRYVGGLVGSNGSGAGISRLGTICSCYSAAHVSGNGPVGGLVANGRGEDVVHCFWDTETSSQNTSAGGMGLTAAEMQDMDTYLEAGWDFIDEIRNGTCDYWEMSPGAYPRLRYPDGDSPVMPEGLGTIEKPYRIQDAPDLGTVWLEPLAHYRMEASVDLSGSRWSMAVIPSFGGTFDGNGYVISNLNIHGRHELGLFGVLATGAKVFNLGLEAVDVEGTGNSVGGLAGKNSGSVGSGSAATNAGSVARCYTTGTITGGECVGGLVGSNEGRIITSYSTGTVTGENKVGGLVGRSGFVARIDMSYSSGAVTGDEDVGGLVGENYHGSIDQSFWDMETSGQSNSDGGMGLVTADMYDIKTYQDVGWDFAEEMGDGLHEFWQMPEGGGYPVLAVFHGYAPPLLQGQGTPEEPYLISDPNELGAIYYYSARAHYCLSNSVDLSGIRWGMAVIPWFEGTFEGNGHAISNLQIQGSDYLGLFGKLGAGAMVSNLNLEAADVNGTGHCVGGLAGWNGSLNEAGGVLANCYGNGTVAGNGYVGGLVGLMGGSEDAHGVLTNCSSTCTVSGGSCVGGLVGYCDWDGIVTGCHSEGAIAATGAVGGLVGSNQGSITASYSAGIVNWSGWGWEAAGGLAGENAGSITRCGSSADVNGWWSVGGLVGSGGNCYACFWDIETSGQITSGGGTGLTTAEMQDITTYLNAGWDFVGEIRNGTWDAWEILPGDYPKLRYLDGDGPVMPEGLGTIEEPYLIRDARDLGTVWFEPSARYRLESSVDLAGITWSMAVVPWFEGVFDGNGYVISNLHIQGVECAGLFGQLVSGAKVFDLGMEAVDVSGIRYEVGGLVGYIEKGSVFNCFSTGTVSGGREVGGLVGGNGGSITTSYSTVAVSGDGRIGGLVGSNGGSITRSYSTGAVSGTGDYVGGFVGTNWDFIDSSFWDIESSGFAASDGAIGRTTAEMQTASTFLEAGWDFVGETGNGTDDIWWILEGRDYPRLWWER